MPFDTVTLKEAEKLIPDRGADWLAANQLFYTGDHWQDGQGWSGPLLEATHALYNEILLEIQRGFVSKNTIKEIVDRHKDGVVGREPMWNMALRRPLAENEEPTADEKTLIDEAEALLTDWWDNRKAHKTIQDAATTLLWAGRGVLRLFVPPGELEDGLIPQADLQTSVDRLYLDDPEPDQATVHTDKRTMQDIGVYLYQEDEQERAELVYLDGGGNTVIRIVGRETDEDDAEPLFTLPLSGHLTLFEMERETLVTEQIRQLQKSQNLALTMLQRNVIQGGFLERTFFNAQLPGREIDDPYAPDGKKFVPDALYVGPGATNFLSGVVTEDEQGRQVVANPSVTYRDPVPVTTFRETKEEMYRCILEEAHQLHATISGDAVAAADSRKQARQDFEQSLRDTRTELENAIRWLLETVLAMAATFSGQPGYFDTLRAVATCRLELGPISADDQRVAAELVEKKVISRETAMSRVGVDDVDAEKTKIEEEQDSDSQRQQQTLATAVLNAQRQMASGAGSNGLERPETEEETE